MFRSFKHKKRKVYNNYKQINNYKLPRVYDPILESRDQKVGYP